MKRNIAIITALIVALVLVASLVLLGLNPSFLNPQKFEVTNMRLTYGSQAYSSFKAFIVFTLRNLDDSYLNTVGITIDGVHFGLSALQLPPGQTQEKSLPLNNLALSSSKTYDITLTFTFADGKYQTHSGSYTAPLFKGEVTVTSLSLTLFTFHYDFHVEVKNTGNLPITMAKFRFFNGFEQILSPMYALPGQTLSGGESLWKGLVEGSAYPVTIQVTYFDGSTSTIDRSVVAQS